MLREHGSLIRKKTNAQVMEKNVLSGISIKFTKNSSMSVAIGNKFVYNYDNHLANIGLGDLS